MDAHAVSAALGDWVSASAVEAPGRLSDRIALAFTHAIGAGLLPAGTRLPPERDLAAVLAVSRPTLRAALTDLRTRGLVGAHHGSGTWIAGTRRRRGQSFAEAVSGDAAVNLAASVAWDARVLVACGFRLTASELLAHTPTDGYGTGLIEIQEIVAARSDTRPANVVITPGAQRGLQSTLELVASTGDRVLIEREAYPGMFDILDTLGLIPIPVDFTDPDAVDRAITRRSPTAAVLQPIVHNPTGGGLTDDQIGALARVFDRRRLPVVENDVLADLRFDGDAPVGLAPRCRTAPVFVLGSLSKTVWGGLRVGWVSAPEPLADDLRRRIHRMEMGQSAPSQIIAVQVLRRLDDVIAARRVELAERANFLRDRLLAELPEWSCEPPLGGLSLWVRLPMRDTAAFAEHASTYGVDVLPGHLTLANRPPSAHIRLSYDRPRPMLAEGVERLTAAWRTFPS